MKILFYLITLIFSFSDYLGRKRKRQKKIVFLVLPKITALLKKV